MRKLLLIILLILLPLSQVKAQQPLTPDEIRRLIQAANPNIPVGDIYYTRNVRAPVAGELALGTPVEFWTGGLGLGGPLQSIRGVIVGYNYQSAPNTIPASYPNNTIINPAEWPTKRYIIAYFPPPCTVNCMTSAYNETILFAHQFSVAP